MIPKKARDFKKSVAQDLGLPEDAVNAFIDFYWERVRKLMSGLECEIIEIPNLGMFNVKHWKIDETVKEHKLTIARAEGKFSAHAVRNDLIDRIEKLEKIKSLVEQRNIKFKAIRDARKAKANMEEQKPDTSGPNQQDLQEGSCGESI